MSALAKYYLMHGHKVKGYDSTPSKITSGLEELGAEIIFQENLSFLENLSPVSSMVVYTPAIPKDSLFLNHFRENNYKILKRAEVLGVLSRNSLCVAIAGTHGKTTISSMVANIFHCSDHAFAAFLGGIARNFNSNYTSREGSPHYTVVEADEFDRSFLQLNPAYGLIANVDADHLDIYKDEQDLKNSFRQFQDLCSHKIVHHENVNFGGISYGQNGDYKYVIKKEEIGKTAVKFILSNRGEIDLLLPFNGEHNICNALGATALCLEAGLNESDIIKGLTSFKGIDRRFNVIYNSKGKVYIDDYAHHPSEIEALMNALEKLFPEKSIVGAFQPHLFSRTKDFEQDFAKQLSRFKKLVLLDIYPARELPIPGVTSDALAEKITTVCYRSGLAEYPDKLTALEGDVYVTIGAGSIGTKVDEVRLKMEELCD